MSGRRESVRENEKEVERTQAAVWWLPERRGWGAVGGGGGLIYGDRGWFDLGWWVHSAIYRSCITERYT